MLSGGTFAHGRLSGQAPGPPLPPPQNKCLTLISAIRLQITIGSRILASAREPEDMLWTQRFRCCLKTVARKKSGITVCDDIGDWNTRDKRWYKFLPS